MAGSRFAGSLEHIPSGRNQPDRMCPAKRRSRQSAWLRLRQHYSCELTWGRPPSHHGIIDLATVYTLASDRGFGGVWAGRPRGGRLRWARPIEGPPVPRRRFSRDSWSGRQRKSRQSAAFSYPLRSRPIRSPPPAAACRSGWPLRPPCSSWPSAACRRRAPRSGARARG